MDEDKLLEKLRLIEAVYSGSSSTGERAAAEQARRRILERMAQTEAVDPPVEHRFTMPDMWSQKVFVALLRRYGIQPYRHSGQRYTTVMARVSRAFTAQTLWPEFLELSDALQAYLSAVTDRVVRQVIHQDSSEAPVVDGGRRLAAAPDSATAVPPSPPPAEASGDRTSGPSGQSESTGGARRRKGHRRRRRKRRRG